MWLPQYRETAHSSALLAYGYYTGDVVNWDLHA